MPNLKNMVFDRCLGVLFLMALFSLQPNGPPPVHDKKSFHFVWDFFWSGYDRMCALSVSAFIWAFMTFVVHELANKSAVNWQVVRSSRVQTRQVICPAVFIGQQVRDQIVPLEPNFFSMRAHEQRCACVTCLSDSTGPPKPTQCHL